MVFLDKSIGEQTANIIEEIMFYIAEQWKNGILNPECYDGILLFISEVLPHSKKQDDWIDLGYRLCRNFKQDIEHNGYSHQVAMFGGLGYKCFAVDAFCKQTGILQGFSSSMNELLASGIGGRIEKIKKMQTFDTNYDVISGISGLLYYMLDCQHFQKERDILITCVKYLLDLTQDTQYCKKPIIRFHILQSNQNPNFDKKDFKDGSINFGLAHGMLGPLIALAKAYAKGFNVDGLEQGIEKLYHLYEIYQVVNDADVPYWPGMITVEEYWEGACRPEHLHRNCSWCYGNIGIIRGLQKAAGYMGWTEREQTYIEAMKRFLAQDIMTYDLNSPSLCHGFSSIVAIQTCAYSAYKDPKLLANLERHTQKIIKAYRKNNERQVNLADIREQRIWVEGYMEDLTFLTGSIGIATTLLSLRGSMKAGKLLMID